MGVVPSQRTVQASAALDRLFWGCEAPRAGNPLWCEPPEIRVDRIFHGEARLYRASLSDVRVIMAIMRVLIVELICQAVTE
jgi:hypothetical protein